MLENKKKKKHNLLRGIKKKNNRIEKYRSKTQTDRGGDTLKGVFFLGNTLRKCRNAGEGVPPRKGETHRDPAIIGKELGLWQSGTTKKTGRSSKKTEQNPEIKGGGKLLFGGYERKE